MIFTTYSEQKESAFGIKLVSCGHIFAKSGREINRPNGRDDWLLFYVVKGSETFYLDSVQEATAGSFALFAPNEKQHHVYNGDATAEFYYIHFKCEKLPDEFSFKSSTIYDMPPSRQVCDVFEDIIEQMLKKRVHYEKLCICKLLCLFSLLERGIVADKSYNESFTRIELAVHDINKNYDSNLSLADYADMCNMSKYHFLRIFKKTVGVTPLEYRNNIRLEHAADMLCEENVSVEQVSFQLGFSSASYFSTVFKERYGVPPKQYQKNFCK